LYPSLSCIEGYDVDYVDANCEHYDNNNRNNADGNNNNRNKNIRVQEVLGRNNRLLLLNVLLVSDMISKKKA
jgi:uncharacterized protein (UPF0179 family)